MSEPDFPSIHKSPSSSLFRPSSGNSLLHSSHITSDAFHPPDEGISLMSPPKLKKHVAVEMGVQSADVLQTLHALGAQQTLSNEILKAQLKMLRVLILLIVISIALFLYYLYQINRISVYVELFDLNSANSKIQGFLSSPVEYTFSAQTKKNMMTMVDGLASTMKESDSSTDWLILLDDVKTVTNMTLTEAKVFLPTMWTTGYYLSTNLNQFVNSLHILFPTFFPNAMPPPS